MALYRLACGGEIVQSTYDFETHRLGPYLIEGAPPLFYNDSYTKADIIEPAQLYNTLQAFPDAIACFNANNAWVFAITKTHQFMCNPTGNPKNRPNNKMFPIKVNSKDYYAVGFVKTYPKCKAAFNLPYYLLMDASTGILVDYDVKLPQKPVVNPPYSLYRSLVNTEHDAIWMDSASNQIHYLDKKPKVVEKPKTNNEAFVLKPYEFKEKVPDIPDNNDLTKYSLNARG